MSRSSAKKGAYYKGRTKKFLAERGYQVADLEVVLSVGGPLKRFSIKRDQFASDLMAVNSTDLVFVQVKGGEHAGGGTTFPKAREEFAKFTFPPFTRRWIVCWAPRAHRPRIIEVNADGSIDPRTDSPAQP